MNNSVTVFTSISEFQKFLRTVNVLPLDINRDIDRRNGVGLRSSILDHGIQGEINLVETSVFTQGQPQLYVIDGQHRRIEMINAAPEKLEGTTPSVRINYSEKIDDILNLVSTLNSSGKKWNLDNYAKAWANAPTANSEDYQKLIDFAKTHQLGINSAILLFSSGRKEIGNASFKAGNFKYKTDSRVTMIIDTYEAALTLGMTRNQGSFKALVTLFNRKDFTVKNYLRNVRLNAPMLKGCNSKETYEKLLK